MDIKILDSHLREHLKTNAKPSEIAKILSLSSASIERVEPLGKDFIYSVEVTTNRPDMLSVRGLAREASTVLPEFGYSAALLPLSLKKPERDTKEKTEIIIKNDETLVRRICAVILEVTQKESPPYIKERLNAAGIRSLNNLVDVTNYVMLEIGHPAHVFDYDRIKSKTLLIRESKKGEKIITLDKKEYKLPGGDIVADNGTGEIIDLLGIMGTANSVVTDSTKRVLFFFDNNDPWKIRKTSMGLAIRTDAAALNEKGVDPELAMEALERGVMLYKEIADAKVISDVIDIYPKKVKPAIISVSNTQISKTIGIEIPVSRSIKILKGLGFEVEIKNGNLLVKVPTWRELDVTIPEDIVEEVARIYGYHNIPTLLPPFEHAEFYHPTNISFFWEQKAKEALKYWGFTECFTYSMVSEILFEGPLEEAVTLNNPLDEDHVHMRKTLMPSLLQVLDANKIRQNVKIFEIANTYHKNKKEKLPVEIRKLAFTIKGKDGTFYHAKGFVEALGEEFGIKKLEYNDPQIGGLGASIYIEHEYLGEIEVMGNNTVSTEINFDLLLKHATLQKTFSPLAKYPPIVEDITFNVKPETKTGDIITVIKEQSKLIIDVSLLDQFEDNKTFHIVYQDPEKNLTNEDVATIREKIIASLEKKFSAKVK